MEVRQFIIHLIDPVSRCWRERSDCWCCALLLLFRSNGPICPSDPVWWTRGPSELCRQLCPSGGLRRAAPRAQPDLRLLSGGGYERRWLWLWSCIWRRWGETWASPGCLNVRALNDAHVGGGLLLSSAEGSLCSTLIWQEQTQYTRWCYDVTHVFEGVMGKCNVENWTHNETFTGDTLIPVISPFAMFECF